MLAGVEAPDARGSCGSGDEAGTELYARSAGRPPRRISWPPGLGMQPFLPEPAQSGRRMTMPKPLGFRPAAVSLLFVGALSVGASPDGAGSPGSLAERTSAARAAFDRFRGLEGVWGGR